MQFNRYFCNINNNFLNIEFISWDEEFRPIDMFMYDKCIIEDRYYISNYGRIFSTFKNTFMMPNKAKNGYRIGLSFYIPGIENKTFRIHFPVAKLVLLAFRYNMNYQNLCAIHLNGIDTDNRLCNLTWGYVSDVSKYNIKNHKYNGSFTDEEVHQICKLLEQNVPLIEIADIMNVSAKNISSINSGVTYKYISKDYNLNPRKKRGPLSQDEFLLVKEKISNGDSCAQISRDTGINVNTISGIKNGKSYTSYI